MTSASADRPRHTFVGIAFSACGPNEALAWVQAAAAGERFAYVVTPNVDHAVMFNTAGPEPWRAAYRAAVQQSDLCLNDSRVLVRLAALSGASLPLVTGSDLTGTLVAAGIPAGASVALVGGHARDAQWLASALPGRRIAHFNPPMGVRDNPRLHDEIAEFIEREGADFAFLAIGAPQAEIVAHRIAQRGRARGVGLCIGASIEFLSGARRRAPRWMQRAGLEWLFRLTSEPRRLWRRYLVDGPRIFRIWWSQRGDR